MDYLPQLKISTADEWQVPFLAQLDYKAQGKWKFKAFPASVNFDFAQKTADEIASFVQSWLYFGLLTEILKTSVDRSRFERYSDERNAAVLSSIALKGLVPQLHPLEDDDSDNEDFQSPPEYQEVSRLLDIAMEQWQIVDRMKISSTAPIPVVLLSIRVLIDTLRYVCLGPQATKLTPVMENDVHSTTVDFLTVLMKSKEWCPFQTRNVLRSFNSVVVCYIAQIRRDGRPNTTHKKCDQDRCVAYNIVNETYETSHVEEYCSLGCRRSFVPIPRREMKEIIDSNGIPLAVLNRNSSGQISLDVKRASRQDSYVAFSHVWSDGLGNLESNSIPRCQLERLDKHLSKASTQASNMTRGIVMGMDMKRMKSIKSTKLFWLDTLCIPVKTPEDAQTPKLDVDTLKREAINRIAAVFAGASRVIVLDLEMEKFKQKHADWNETIARFLFSAWMGRCWTLEEGALSQAPHVKCEDGSFDPTSKADASLLYGLFSSPTLVSYTGTMARVLWRAGSILMGRSLNMDTNSGERLPREFDRRIDKLLSVTLLDAITKAFMQDTVGKAKGGDPEEEEWDYFNRFCTCWDALSTRDTSRAKDRLSILANLLNLNTFLLTKRKLPMLGLLQSLPAVPVSMLYNGRMNDQAEKEDKDRFYRYNNRWLPCYPTMAHLSSKHSMTWAEGGLELVAKKMELNGFHYPPGTAALLLEPALLHPSGSFDIFRESFLRYCRYRVQFIRQENESKLQIDSIATCLLIGTDNLAWDKDLIAGSSIRGACLQVVGKTEEIIEEQADRERSQGSDAEAEPQRRKICLSTVYDCPIRISLVELGSEISKENSIPCKALSSWSLKLACDFPEGEEVPPPRRPVNNQLFQTFLVFLIPVPFHFLGAISTYLFIAITIKTFSHLPVLGKLAVLFVFFVRLVAIIFNIFTYNNALSLLAAVFYTVVKAHVGHLSGLDCAFIVFAGIGYTGVMAWYLFHKYYLGLKLYQEWQDSFNPEWRSEGDMEWTERMNRFSYWIYRLAIRD